MPQQRGYTKDSNVDGLFELESELQYDGRNKICFMLSWLRETERERVKKESQNFYEVAWMSVEENLREENSVYERLVAHTWWSDYFDPE